jgi:anti-sigma regulatory factor (Ser/Thr protein kinase)
MKRDAPPASDFAHGAFVYDADDDLADVVGPYLQRAVEDGAPAIAVLTRSNWAIVREALGPVAEQVSHTDCDSFYTHPARAVAAYDVTLRGHAARGTPPVRVVGELPFGPTETEWDRWAGYEAILNRALEHHAVSVLCAYDARVLPDRLVDIAYRTHPHVDGAAGGSHPAFEDPAQLVGELTPAAVEAPGLIELEPCGEDAGAFRWQLGAVLAAADVPRARALDMIVAATEVFVNACRHGGGPDRLRAGAVEGWFACEVSDSGPGFDDPLAGYLPPRAGDRPQKGLWIARQLVSRLELMPRRPGLTARLWL